MHRRIDELTPHPKNFEIYGQESVTDDLLASVKSKGVMVPLTITSENVIISGHRRYEAAKMAGLEIVPVGIATFESELDELEAIIEFNRQREKTFVQKMKEAETLDLIETERAKNRMLAAQNNKAAVEIFPQLPTGENTGKTRDKVAQQTGIGSGKTYEVAKKIWNKAKEGDEAAKIAVSKIEKGELTIHGAKKELDKGQKSIEIARKREEYQERISTRAPDNLFVDIFNTAQKFRIIYADPPWSYNDKCDKGGVQSGGVELRHYNTMSIKEICDIPIKNISEDNSVLFLWVTSPLLEDSFSIINAWGFKYKTSFVWDKVGHNMGHYNSVRHEMLLIATRGSCTPDNKTLYDSVQSIEKTDKHSQKPVEFLNIIDDLYIYGDRIELFARERQKDGWFLWGNEI